MHGDLQPGHGQLSFWRTQSKGKVMPEWVHWENLHEQHRYQEENDEKFCWICGKDADNHWFPVTEVSKYVAFINEVDEVAKRAWENT